MAPHVIDVCPRQQERVLASAFPHLPGEIDRKTEMEAVLHEVEEEQEKADMLALVEHAEVQRGIRHRVAHALESGVTNAKASAHAMLQHHFDHEGRLHSMSFADFRAAIMTQRLFRLEQRLSTARSLHAVLTIFRKTVGSIVPCDYITVRPATGTRQRRESRARSLLLPRALSLPTRRG
jgi:hypothetical protein